MAAKKKAEKSPVETGPEKAKAPAKAGSEAVAAIEKAVSIIDPRGTGHIPSGDPAIYQEVLEVLKSVE